MKLEELDVLMAKPLGREDPRSPLMKAKAKAKIGQVINVCPYGCKGRQLDENGYCRHLVGFTRDKETYEPMVMRKGRRRIEVPMRGTGEFQLGEDKEGNPIEEEIMEPDLPRMQPGDKICRVSDCYRVYRDVPLPQRPEQPAGQLPNRGKKSV
jgi:hypothetical protein